MNRHQHSVAYATIVLEGSYIEWGSAGRWAIEAGQVVAHRMFDSHANHVVCKNARVLNLPIPLGRVLPHVFTVNEPDALISAVQRGSSDAANLLEPAQVSRSHENDWTDVLASALSAKPLSISSWAVTRGIAPATISRGFMKAYGISPSRFRLEAQTIKALQSLMKGSCAPADIAAEQGFSDQAHLCRSVKAMTGQTPSQWQRIKSIQDIDRVS